MSFKRRMLRPSWVAIVHVPGRGLGHDLYIPWQVYLRLEGMRLEQGFMLDDVTQEYAR